MEINPKEAEVVRSVFHDYINGKTTTAIARKLQKRGVPTRFGGPWSVRRIINMLTGEQPIALFNERS
ncbi:recombinase family protein [Desulfitobacterium hafniense]|uniref:recombinase family protein n=1 Tax=Desulfitobacterium hafniense TaxID=49338 RepID=UPI00036B1A65